MVGGVVVGGVASVTVTVCAGWVTVTVEPGWVTVRVWVRTTVWLCAIVAFVGGLCARANAAAGLSMLRSTSDTWLPAASTPSSMPTKVQATAAEDSNAIRADRDHCNSIPRVLPSPGLPVTRTAALPRPDRAHG